MGVRMSDLARALFATGDYDAIIIGHSQFERIPVSMERQERHQLLLLRCDLLFLRLARIRVRI